VLAFYIDSNLSEDQFRQLEDSLTVSPGAYRFGAINVHTAPVEVLACLPGVTREKAEELVSSRQSLSEEQRQSVAWLTTVLDPDVARLVGPHVTAQTWQYRLDITAVGRHGRGVRRMRAIVDVEDGVNVIQRRDLSRGGWALGEEVRLQLAEGRMGR
jgi:type II secretory pathway component PulK